MTWSLTERFCDGIKVHVYVDIDVDIDTDR